VREREREREKKKEKIPFNKKGKIINKDVQEGDPPLLSPCKNVSLWGAACDTGAVVEGGWRQ